MNAPDDRPAVEQLLDLVLYGPLGLVLGGPGNVNELARRGRERCEANVNNAKLVGKYAVQRGSRHVQLRIARLIDHNESHTDPIETRAEPRASKESVAFDPRAEQIITVRHDDSEGLALPIPEYDSLAASQVVPRLAGLTLDELEAVRSYEAARRGRRTILAKIAQLQGV